MLNWLLRLVGYGPVARAFAARFRARIAAAETAVVQAHENLDAKLERELETIRNNHVADKARAIETAVEGLLGGK